MDILDIGQQFPDQVSIESNVSWVAPAKQHDVLPWLNHTLAESGDCFDNNCWPITPGNETYKCLCPGIKNKLITKICRSHHLVSASTQDFCDNVVEFHPQMSRFWHNGPMSNWAINHHTGKDWLAYTGLILSMISLLIVFFCILCTRKRKTRINQVRAAQLLTIFLAFLFRAVIHADWEVQTCGKSLIKDNVVCDTIIFVFEWLHVFWFAWLACICIHALLSSIGSKCSKRFYCVIIYFFGAVVYASVVTIIWFFLMQFVQAITCNESYVKDPLIHILIWSSFLPIAVSTACSFAQIVYSLLKILSRDEFRVFHKKWLFQATIHFVLCCYSLAFWYYQYWSRTYSTMSAFEGEYYAKFIIIFFSGVFTSYCFALSQACLPAKDRTYT